MVKPLSDLGSVGMPIVKPAGTFGGEPCGKVVKQGLARDEQEGPKYIVRRQKPPLAR